MGQPTFPAQHALGLGGDRPYEALPSRSSSPLAVDPKGSLHRRFSRWLRRLGDIMPTSTRRGSAASFNYDWISSPLSSEVSPATAARRGDAVTASCASALTCFSTAPTSLAAYPSDCNLLQSNSKQSLPTLQERPPRPPSPLFLQRPPAAALRHRHRQCPVSPDAFNPPAPLTNVGSLPAIPLRYIQTAMDGEDGGSAAVTTPATASPHFPKARPRTLLRRWTSRSDTSSSSHSHHGPTPQGPTTATVETTAEEGEQAAEEATAAATREPAAPGARLVLTSRFSDWSSTETSRTPSPFGATCGCRWSWWSLASHESHEGLQSSTTTGARRVLCAEHATLAGTTTTTTMITTPPTSPSWPPPTTAASSPTSPPGCLESQVVETEGGDCLASVASRSPNDLRQRPFKHLAEWRP